MREIKFRGLRQFNGTIGSGNRWIHSSLLKIDYERKMLNLGGETCQFETIGQFTGLLDKNGKEIYEGDIIHGREEGDCETTAWTETFFMIVYDEKIAGFMAHECGLKTSSWDEQICELNAEYEVIGNIHENPELLEGKQ